MAFNLVELVTAGEENCGFDQPCKFGHRVEGHAVYCHNDAWPDSPRKCRRTWYTGGETKDEDCPGFQPNPEFKGAFNQTPINGERCSKCGGSKLINGDRETVETCPLCMGSGEQPSAIKMSQFAQDTLELCCIHSGKHPAQYDYNARVAETKSEADDISMLEDNDCVKVRSMTWTKSGATVFLYKMTAKGDAVMRANWAAKKANT